MFLPRILSNSSSQFSTFAIASPHYQSFLVPSFHFDNASCRMRRYFSAYPRFDFGTIREPNDAVALFREMVRTQPLPYVSVFSKLLSTVVKMKQYSLALHLIDEMLQRDVPVDHYTLNIAIDCYCRQKRPDFGFAILGIFFKRGYEPCCNFTTLYGLLLVGRSQRQLNSPTLLPLGDKGISPMCDIYSIIEGLCKEKNGRGKTFRRRCLLYGLPMWTCNIFVTAWCKDGKVQEAEHMLVSMKEIDVQPISLTALINGYCMQGKMDEAVRIFQLAVNSGIKPNIVSYNSLMNGYCKKGQVDEVSWLFTIIPAKRLERNVISYNIMLEALFRKGRCEDGLNLFKEMQALGLSPHVKTYNILLHGLCSAHRITEAFSMLHTMEDKCVVPDIVIYTVLIEGLCINNKVREAKGLFDELPSKGMQPNVVTYTILIGALCEEGHTEEAKDLMMQMVNNGCLPNSVTYNVFVQGLLKRNKASDAIPLLEEMYARGFTLDETTFSMLIGPMVREGRDSVLFDKIKKLVPKDLYSR
uniref:Pentatricopeptide repeat protein n=1 Tax=Salvia miltiorrhiza TaxID=226208 RepID=A0A678WH06_SALMI|nr:pentatricopeptide repeat protein [Salvia miltiorrhiza]